MITTEATSKKQASPFGPVFSEIDGYPGNSGEPTLISGYPNSGLGLLFRSSVSVNMDTGRVEGVEYFNDYRVAVAGTRRTMPIVFLSVRWDNRVLSELEILNSRVSLCIGDRVGRVRVTTRNREAISTTLVDLKRDQVIPLLAGHPVEEMLFRRGSLALIGVATAIGFPIVLSGALNPVLGILGVLAVLGLSKVIRKRRSLSLNFLIRQAVGQLVNQHHESGDPSSRTDSSEPGANKGSS